MLTHPTHEVLSALKLDGMAEAFAELITQGHGRSLDPIAWIGADARLRAGSVRLAGRAMHALVGDLPVPSLEVRDERRPAREAAPGDRVALHIADAALVPALVRAR